jgi:hypothetical protein
MTAPRTNGTPLDESEQRRLDELLKAARTLHTAALAVAGLSVVLSAIGGEGLVTIPLGSVQVPYLPAVILTYLLCMLLSSSSALLLRVALPFISLDPRRPPFAWILFATRSLSRPLILAWVLFPVIVSCFATSAALSQRPAGAQAWVPLTPLALLFVGMGVYGLPGHVVTYSEMLRDRRDLEGRPLTLSVYLHFWMRLIRGTTFSIGLLLLLLRLLPSWRGVPVGWVAAPFLIGASAFVACNLALPFRKRIDRYGFRHGFAERYDPADGASRNRR